MMRQQFIVARGTMLPSAAGMPKARLPAIPGNVIINTARGVMEHSTPARRWCAVCVWVGGRGPLCRMSTV